METTEMLVAERTFLDVLKHEYEAFAHAAQPIGPYNGLRMAAAAGFAECYTEPETYWVPLGLAGGLEGPMAMTTNTRRHRPPEDSYAASRIAGNGG